MSDLYVETRLQAIKDIASASCVDIKDADNIASFCDEIYSAIPKIDKIVEELKKVKTINVDVGYGTIYKTIRKDVAIEIVKQCSVSGDVCEWKYDKHFEFAKSKCGSLDTHRIDFLKMKYCPYCSKKIKIVGD